MEQVVELMHDSGTFGSIAWFVCESTRTAAIATLTFTFGGLAVRHLAVNDLVLPGYCAARNIPDAVAVHELFSAVEVHGITTTLTESLFSPLA